MNETRNEHPTTLKTGLGISGSFSFSLRVVFSSGMVCELLYSFLNHFESTYGITIKSGLSCAKLIPITPIDLSTSSFTALFEVTIPMSCPSRLMFEFTILHAALYLFQLLSEFASIFVSEVAIPNLFVSQYALQLLMRFEHGLQSAILNVTPNVFMLSMTSSIEVGQSDVAMNPLAHLAQQTIVLDM